MLLKSPFEEQFSVECRQFSEFHRSCHTSLRDWPRELSPFSQPIRCKRKINCDLIIRVFPRLTQFSFSTSNSHRLDRIFPFAPVCWNYLVLVSRHSVEKRSVVINMETCAMIKLLIKKTCFCTGKHFSCKSSRRGCQRRKEEFKFEKVL